MKARLLEQGDETTYAVVMEVDDEAISVLQAWAAETGLVGGRLSAIGAFSEATLGYFDWSTKDYRRIEVPGQVEVVSMVGDIARTEDGAVTVHAHAVLGRPDASVLGGHLLAGRVRPTLEVMVIDSPTHLRRTHDPRSGLALIDLDAPDPGT